jgi:hypothetical protein
LGRALRLCLAQRVARAPFFTGCRCLFGCPLMGCSTRLRSTSSLAGDLSPAFWTHGREAARTFGRFYNHLFQPFSACVWSDVDPELGQPRSWRYLPPLRKTSVKAELLLLTRLNRTQRYTNTKLDMLCLYTG